MRGREPLAPNHVTGTGSSNPLPSSGEFCELSVPERRSNAHSRWLSSLPACGDVDIEKIRPE